MGGMAIGFMIWGLFGCIIIGLGVYSAFSKKPVGFWANAEMFEVTDTKRYNHAVAKLFCIYGVILIILGLPLLVGQNSAWILISIFGLMFESIVAMAVYTLVIEKKYKKNNMI